MAVDPLSPLLRARLPSVAWVTALTLALATIAHLVSGAWLVAAVVAPAAAVAGLVWVGCRWYGLSEVRPERTLSLLFVVVAGSSLLAGLELPMSVVDVWMVMVVVTYGALQYHTGWHRAGLAVVCSAWALTMLVGPFESFRSVHLLAAMGLSVLAHGSQVRFLARVQAELARRRQLEQERESMREQWVASQRMEAVGNLAGGVAHELNNVLGGIVGLATLIREDVAPGARADVEAILAAAVRGGELTSALLGFSRRGGLKRASVPLSEVMNELSPLLLRSCPSQVSLVFNVEDDLWALVNRTEFAQAVVNLVLNAYGAKPRSQVVVSVRRGRSDQVSVSVTDDGSGMPDSVRSRIFEPFFTTKPRGEGTGLGLAQVYGMVQRCEGSIEVTSKVGEGTTFAIRLPRSEAAELQRRISLPPRLGQQPRILVADDEPLLRRVAQRMLSRVGMHVDLATHGEEALQMARSGVYDLVLLDLTMPRLDGLEVLVVLREEQPELPVIVVSGYVAPEVAQACIDAGVTAILQKPMSPRELISTVRQHVLTAAA